MMICGQPRVEQPRASREIRMASHAKSTHQDLELLAAPPFRRAAERIDGHQQRRCQRCGDNHRQQDAFGSRTTIRRCTHSGFSFTIHSSTAEPNSPLVAASRQGPTPAAGTAPGDQQLGSNKFLGEPVTQNQAPAPSKSLVANLLAGNDLRMAVRTAVGSQPPWPQLAKRPNAFPSSRSAVSCSGSS